MIKNIFRKIKEYFKGKSIVSFEIRLKDGSTVVIDEPEDVYNIIKASYSDLLDIIKSEIKFTLKDSIYRSLLEIDDIIYNWNLDFYLGIVVKYIIEVSNIIKGGDIDNNNIVLEKLMKAVYYLEQKIKYSGMYSNPVALRAGEYDIQNIQNKFELNPILFKILEYIYKGLNKDALQLLMKLIGILMMFDKKNISGNMDIAKKMEVCEVIISKDIVA